MAEFRGPLFDGRADAAAARMCDEIEERIGDEGVAMVRSTLGQVLRNPTGRYESSINASPAGGGVEVNDRGIIYGPWLEGTGSRNRTTRFKGYATFRRVAQALGGRARTIAEPIVSRYVRGM